MSSVIISIGNEYFNSDLMGTLSIFTIPGLNLGMNIRGPDCLFIIWTVVDAVAERKVSDISYSKR
jgi:hypothetical protein